MQVSVHLPSELGDEFTPCNRMVSDIDVKVDQTNLEKSATMWNPLRYGKMHGETWPRVRLLATSLPAVRCNIYISQMFRMYTR